MFSKRSIFSRENTVVRCSSIRGNLKFTKIFMTVFLTFCSLPMTGSESASGFYVDNGSDQTILQELSTRKMKREMKKDLLNVLDMPDRPKRIPREAAPVKRSASKFLYDIYTNGLYDIREGTEKLTADHLGEFKLTSRDIRAIDQSDVIMTFGAYNPHAKHGPRDNRGRRIWFDVSEVPRAETILAGELRMYRENISTSLQSDTSYAIRVYRVSRNVNGDRKKVFVDSTNITAEHRGWIRLNISQALRYWMTHPEENRGLFVGIYRAGFDHSRLIKPSDFGIQGILDPPEKQPFMVGFFKNFPGIRYRGKRSPRKIQDAKTSLTLKNPYVHQLPGKSNEPCNVRTLYVNFKDLQWQDWIIAPTGFEGNYCAGRCDFPLKMNATNHAILQTLVSLMKPEMKVPPACCAPTKLSSMSVLYYLDESNVVLKKYTNMIVESCGCQ